ncbi:MAG: GTPase domain-containing protein, partial [Promethearchaeota archaeon]
MISKIFIIAAGGKLCYSKDFLGKNSFDNDLVSGFLSAFSDFAIELTAGEIKSLNFHNFNFVYEYDAVSKCMFVLVIDADDIEEEARAKIDLLKNEFLKRYGNELEHWTGNISIFKKFDEFTESNVFIPPKILIIGERGVGKSTIMKLFPGELIIRVTEDLEEIIEKTINVSGLKSVKQFVMREIEMEEILNRPKLYERLLKSANIICLISNSSAKNLSITKKFLNKIKLIARRADFYLIANFQDMKDIAFESEKIEKAFGIKTFPISAIEFDAKEKMRLIMG